MKVAALIAEYNPFHNGHKYQLEQIRQKTHCDRIIVIMSGDFVQRGVPAIMDKYTRARHALENGADMVIELPVMWATGSAEYFAKGAISIIEELGCVNYLAFGCEHEDMELLESLARLYTNEPDDYKRLLRQCLKEGASFPTARSVASQLFYMQNKGDPLYRFPIDCSVEQIKSVLAEPNSILAISYLTQLFKRESHIRPVLIKRQGASYHSSEMHELYSSATAIREEIGRVLHGESSYEDNIVLKGAVPQSVYSTLKYYHKEAGYISSNDFSSELRYTIMRTPEESLARFADGGDALAKRCKNLLSEFTDYEGFCDTLKTKTFTRARISRFLCHTLLGVSSFITTETALHEDIYYARVLGFREENADIVSVVNQKAKIPVIMNLPRMINHLPMDATTSLQMDIYAANLYMFHQRDISGTDYIDELSRPVLVVGNEKYRPRQEDLK